VQFKNTDVINVTMKKKRPNDRMKGIVSFFRRMLHFQSPYLFIVGIIKESHPNRYNVH